MIFLLLKKKSLSFLLLLLVSVLYLDGSGGSLIHAQTPTPTPTATPIPVPLVAAPMQIKEALGFNNIASSGADDFFVLFRYELSIGTSPNQYWCKSPEYLVNDSGCELDPPNPDFPFSLKEGFVFAEFTDSTGQVHIQNTKVPRIHKGIMGMYSEAPASSSFGFNANKIPANVCLKYNQDRFTGGNNNPNVQCANVQNISGGSQALAEQISGSSGILYNLENDLGLPLNTLVSSAGLITPIGQKYMEEALQGVGVIAINSNGESVFELGAVDPNRNFNNVGSNIEFQNRINTEIDNSGAGDSLSIISGEYLGFSSGGLTATLIFTALGIIVGAGIIIATGNSFFSLLGTVTMMLPSIFIGGLSIGFLFTLISLGIVFGSWYWIRRSPE